MLTLPYPSFLAPRLRLHGSKKHGKYRAFKELFVSEKRSGKKANLFFQFNIPHNLEHFEIHFNYLKVTPWVITCDNFDETFLLTKMTCSSYSIEITNFSPATHKANQN